MGDRTDAILGGLGLRVADTFFRMEHVIVRRARKAHRCYGGHDGERRVPCGRPISAGDTYIEYLGESPAYSSGQRYHLACAEQQGLIEGFPPRSGGHEQSPQSGARRK